jgi:hypothetical protein
MIEALILYLLEVHATTGVSSNLLDSGGNGVRVYHNRIRQGHGKNAVVFRVLTQTPIHCRGGIALREVSVSFNVHHESDYEAAYIAEELVQLIDNYSGTHEGTAWSYAKLERMTEGFDDDQTLPRKIVDFLFVRQN